MPRFDFSPEGVRSDDWQTPPYALNPLLPYLKADWLIWEPAAGKGQIVTTLRDRGFLVYPSDIKNRRDFLNPKGKHAEELEYIIGAYNCIVTNPPYSVKQEFLERAYELGKPFAFLLPLFTFEGPSRQSLFDRYGVEVIFLDKRVTFSPPRSHHQTRNVTFTVCWFTWQLNIGKQMTFARLSKNGDKPTKKG